MSRTIQFLFIVFAAIACGCSADRPLNPSMPLTWKDAKSALKEMETHPKALARPVLVLSGYIDPGIVSSQGTSAIRKYTGDDRVLSVHYALEGSFDDCRDEVIAKLEAAYPSDRDDETIEVDVVAVSMGGLVGRYAALTPSSDTAKVSTAATKRLRIRRLFTISTPHRGANMATLPTFNGLQRAMRSDSTFLTRLDEAQAHADYDMYCYVRIDDMVVGEENAAPPGSHAWWVANAPMQGAHLNAHKDPRILADILRRLRGEKPFATSPPAPLPDEQSQP